MKIYRDKIGAVNPEHGRDPRRDAHQDDAQRDGERSRRGSVEFSDDDRNTDTTEHASQVRAVAAGRNIIEESVAFRPQISKPAPTVNYGAKATSNSGVLIRPWNPERPLEGDALPVVLLSNSRRWSQTRGRYTHFRVSRKARGRLIRSVPAFAGSR